MTPRRTAAPVEMYRGWLDPFRSVAQQWARGTFEAQRILATAARRARQDAREAASGGAGPAGPAYLVRLGDLYRSQALLWAAAGFTAGERLGRAAPGAAPEWLPRAAVIGTVTADLYLGYATLRERSRWAPGLVEDLDRGLQHRRGAARVLDAAAALGGALIKAAQFASTRPDLLPADYTSTLSALQDRVPSQPWSVMEPAIARELESPVDRVFDHVDPEPIAAASIAQVHRARLTNGREVAVKIQYPHVAGTIEADLSALERTFAALAAVEPSVRLQPIADYLRWTLPLELDFRREADALAELRAALEDRRDVVVPGVVERLTTGRLLVMDFVEGVKVTDRDAMLVAGIDPREVARLLNDVYADQMFVRRVLHADPHPGNILVQPGPRLALLDHGLTTSLEPPFVGSLARLVRALRGGDLEQITGALRASGIPVSEDTDLDTLLGVVGVLLGAESTSDDGTDNGTGGEALDLADFGRRLGASVGDVPQRLLLVGRAIGLLDGITRQLDPELDSLEVVGRYTGEPETP